MARSRNLKPLTLAAACGSLAGFLGLGMWRTPQDPGLADNVHRHLDLSGVQNPVTAVLLNFRGYDTLLEVAVLVLALVATWSLNVTRVRGEARAVEPVLLALARLLFPLTILIAGYLLWKGAYTPGGAFQAGALLGASGVLLLVANLRLFAPTPSHLMWMRVVFVTGLAAFVIVGVAGLFWRGQFLAMPPAQAGVLILIIESASTLSIGAILAALFWGGEPVQLHRE